MPVFMPLIRNLTGNTTLNVHYGEEAPADTSKLWVKRSTEAIGASVGVAEPAVRAVTETLEATAYAACWISAVPVGTKVYLCGGRQQYGQATTIMVFDTETKTYETTGVTLPTATCLMGSAAVGTKVYLFGGWKDQYHALSTVVIFDTETYTLETVSFLYTIRASCCAAFGTKIYVLGGGLGTNATPNNYCFIFDTETNQTTLLGRLLPVEIANAAHAVVGSKVYIFGGITPYSGSSSTHRHDSIQVFDTETNSAVVLDTVLPFASEGMVARAEGTKVYLYGGDQNAKPYYSDAIMVFDTETSSFETLESTLPFPAYGFGISVVGNDVYLFGGYSYVNGVSKYYNTILRLRSFAGLDADTAYLHASATENVFLLISGDYPVTLGVNAVYVGNIDDEAELQEAYLYDETTSEWKPI